jgi:hypothetical protein
MARKAIHVEFVVRQWFGILVSPAGFETRVTAVKAIRKTGNGTQHSLAKKQRKILRLRYLTLVKARGNPPALRMATSGKAPRQWWHYHVLATSGSNTSCP